MKMDKKHKIESESKSQSSSNKEVKLIRKESEESDKLEFVLETLKE